MTTMADDETREPGDGFGSDVRDWEDEPVMLTRAEAAYAHLASFQRGELVDVQGREIGYRAVVMVPQQHDYADINRAHLIVSSNGTEVRITVGTLLAGQHAIRPAGDPGDFRYFDARRYHTDAATVPFALRTDDTAWIARNHGITGPSGRVLVQVPADQVEKVTFCGHPHLRHRFADVPEDAGNGHIMCPAIWVETPEVTAGRPEALDGKALFLARMRGEC